MAKVANADSSSPQIKSTMGKAPDTLDLARMIDAQLSASDTETEETEVDADAEATEETEDQTDVLSQDETEESSDDTAADEESTEDDSTEEGADTEDGEEADPKLEYPKFRKRVDELTRQKKDALEKAEKLEARIKELEEARQEQSETSPPPTGDNPFAALKSLQEVRAEAQRAEDIIRWAIRNPDGAVVKTDKGEVEYTAEQIAEIRYNAEKALRTDLPEHANYITQNEQFNRVAQDQFPWWKDKSAREYSEAMQVATAFPELKRFPEWKLALGDMIEGRKLREARANTAVKAKARPVAPAQPRKTTVAPVAAPKKEVAREAARKQLLKGGGSEKDIARYLAQTF